MSPEVQAWMDKVLDGLGDDATEENVFSVMKSIGVPKEYQKDIAEDLGISLPEPGVKGVKFSLTPEQWELLKKMEREGVVQKSYIMKTPQAARTIKALEKKDLVGRDSRYNFILNTRGEKLVAMTPRWSGETQDDFNRGIRSWCVYDYGDHFSSFSEDRTRPDARLDLGEVHDRTTPFSDERVGAFKLKAKLLLAMGVGEFEWDVWDYGPSPNHPRIEGKRVFTDSDDPNTVKDKICKVFGLPPEDWSARYVSTPEYPVGGAMDFLKLQDEIYWVLANPEELVHMSDEELLNRNRSKLGTQDDKGLRAQPDYMEPGSQTYEMNEENAKG